MLADRNSFAPDIEYLLRIGAISQTAPLFEQRLQIQPNNSELIVQAAYYLRLAGQLSRSKELLNSIKFYDANFKLSQFHLAWHDVFEGRHLEGFRKMALGRQIWKWGAYSDFPLAERWNGVDSTENLVIVGEGGYGDHVMTLGMLPNLIKSAPQSNLIFLTKPELVEIFRRKVSYNFQVAEYSAVASIKNFKWIAGLEFYHFFGRATPTFPKGSYLIPAPDYLNKWKNILTERVRQRRIVGLRFSGDQNHDLELFRQLPLKKVEELILANPDIIFVSLYKDSEKRQQIQASNWLDISNEIRNWEDTLALISLVDHVVSTCTSVAHFAAAAGKSTNILLAIWPYYSWAQEQQESYWYGPHVQCYRQTEFQNWSEPLAEITHSLRKLTQ